MHFTVGYSGLSYCLELYCNYFRTTALSAPLLFVTRYVEVSSCVEMSITSK